MTRDVTHLCRASCRPASNCHLTNRRQIEAVNGKWVWLIIYHGVWSVSGEKSEYKHSVCVPSPPLCARVTVAIERATIIYSLSYLEPLVKVPGDQLSLEPTGAAALTGSSKLTHKCYKQTGPQETWQGPPGTLGPAGTLGPLPNTETNLDWVSTISS